jgi:phosphate transport system permease protein
MSTTKTQIPAPSRPWQKTPREAMPTAVILLVSLLVVAAIVEFTELKGKLAYFLLFLPIGTAAQFFWARYKYGTKAAKDVIASSIMMTGAIAVFIPVISIVLTTFVKGLPGISPSLFTNDMGEASFIDPVEMGGLLHAIVGTLFLILISVLISVPMGMLTALYLTEIRGPGSRFIQFMVQAMSGVPSVVAGLFIFSAVILTTPLDTSGFVASLALSILMIPTVTRASQEVLLLIPNDLREAGLAMGATQWRTVAMIVVPAAKSGLITASILGVARIAGETAPLIFTLGGADKLNTNPVYGIQSALPFYIWTGFRLGTPESVQRSWSGILVLLVIVLVLFTIARLVGSNSKGAK